MLQLHSAVGLVALAALAWVLSEDRRRAGHLKVAAVGLAMQLVLALILLKLPPVAEALGQLTAVVAALQQATQAGAGFVFGYLGGGPAPFQVTAPEASFLLAFQALPLILLVSALSALLTYWRILPAVVRGFAFVLEKSLGVGGAVGLSAAANVFVGMVEAPLMVRPYLSRLTRSELFMVMVTGMATIAGTVLALYAVFLAGRVPDAAGHLLVASVLSAPAAITVARLMLPEAPGTPPTDAALPPDPETTGAMDAITRGTMNGLNLLLGVVAMLLVLVALVHLANALLGLLPELAGAPLTLERKLGGAMAPLVWLTGIPWAEAPTAGALMGTKTVLNELIAYLQLAQLPEAALSPRSRLVMTDALCGFANFASLGILIAGLAGMVPERRAEIAGLGIKSIVGGTLATLMTGAVVGMFTA